MELFGVLKVIWWGLLGVLLCGIAVMVGMDMGVGAALRGLGRTDGERRAILNIIGPHWDGNQVWFILGGGAIFAAWPIVYATAFSGLYVVMLLLLWSMILRPLGFEYRSKMPTARWRNMWDWALFVSGAVPMLIFGTAVGNLFLGFPFHFAWDMQSYYTGSFLSLFNPFSLLCGLTALTLALYQGAATVMNGGEGAIRARARNLLTAAGLGVLVLFTIGGVWVARLTGYVLGGGVNPNGSETPLYGQATRQAGAWLGNYHHHPLLWLLPALVYVALLAGIAAGRRGASYWAWWLGVLAWIGVFGTVGAALFPFMMPSRSVPDQSLTVWNASSNALCLEWMLGFTLLVLPMIVIYTSWCFWIMRGKVTPVSVEGDHDAY